MGYQEDFALFWGQVEKSVADGTFAKLTMAKSIGKPDLKNIFLRPLYAKNGFSVLLKKQYRSRDKADFEEEMTLQSAFKELSPYLKTSFFTVILFTTEADITFKLNKKGASHVVNGLPTFTEIPTVIPDTDS